jgi:hypothetical protein
MIIHVYGSADKRLVVYPLLRMFNELDGGILVTDNGAYRALHPDGSGHIGNVKILYAPDLEGVDIPDYGNVLLDTWQPPKEEHFSIWVKRTKEHLPAPQVEHEVLYIDYTVPPPYFVGKKKIMPAFVIPNMAILKNLYQIESMSKWVPFVNSPLIDKVSVMFSKFFDIPPKSVKSILTSGGVVF